jgi:hypothetical protein
LEVGLAEQREDRRLLWSDLLHLVSSYIGYKLVFYYVAHEVPLFLSQYACIATHPLFVY